MTAYFVVNCLHKMCHYEKCIENAYSYSNDFFLMTYIVFINSESIRHCFFKRIYKTCHNFYTWIGCVQGTPPFYIVDFLLLQFISINIFSSYFYLSSLFGLL